MITLSVPDMTCGHCKASVEAVLLPLNMTVLVDLPKRVVTLGGAAAPDAAIAALTRIGYPAVVVPA